MAAGDLITVDYQFEFNGLLMGPLTPYDLNSVDGLDLPAVRTGDDDRPVDHGAFDLSADWLPARLIDMDLDVITNLAIDLDNLATATKDRVGTYPLVFQLQGTKQVVYCRVRRRQAKLDLMASLGSWNQVIQFWAPNPRVYANLMSSTATGPATSSGGLGFPFGFTIGFGTLTAGTAICVNAGNMDTWPIITLIGPLTNPTIVNQTMGLTWSATIDIASGDTLVVNFDAKTALLNGSADRCGTLTGKWFPLIPGTNVLKFAVSTGTGVMQVAWRSAWDSAV